MTNKNLTIDEQLKKYPHVWPKFVITIVAIVALYLLMTVTITFKGVNPKGVSIAINAFKGLFTPSISLITNLTEYGLLYMLFETLAIAFLGTIFGLIISLPLAFLASRNVCPKWVNSIVLTIISIIRAFPSFMLGIMFVKSIGPGAFAGVLSMTVGSVGMLSKLMIEAIEDLNPGITEALDAAGCSTFEKIRYGIIPQLSSNIVSIVLYRLDINVKNATILGIVQAGGIGAQLIFAINARRWNDCGAMLLGIIVMTLLLEWFSTSVRRKLTGSKN
jgi:phosphonate transport system permease protein